MKTGIYWQDPKYPGRGMDFIFDSSLVLYLPLHKLDGASFMSRDAYGHLCAVTGAEWRLNGRYLDGSDDKITIPDHAALDLTTAATFIVWIHPDSTANWKRILEKAFNAPYTGYELYFHNNEVGIYLNNGTMNQFVTDGVISTSGFSCVGVVFNGSTVKAYVNGTEKAVSIVSGSVPASITPNDNPLYIGRRVNYAEGESFEGVIGEFWAYNEPLSAIEIQRNYLATKWRYR